MLSRSSIKAEFRALDLTAREIVWILKVLLELYVNMFEAPMIFCDNISANYLVKHLIMLEQSI